MSYEPTQWKAGDTVTSAKLNKMEQGIASAGGANILVAHYLMPSEEDSTSGLRAISNTEPETLPGTLDVTLGEILNADFIIVQISEEHGVTYLYVNNITSDAEGYTLHLSNGPDFYAETEEDYPAIMTISPPGDGGTTPIIN